MMCHIYESGMSYTSFDCKARGNLEISAHGWMSRVTHINESCPTNHVSLVWMSHVTHRIWSRGAGRSRDQGTLMIGPQLCALYAHGTGECVWRSHVTCLSHIWMSHIWTSHVTYEWVMYERVDVWRSRVTYEWVIYERVMWHMNESCIALSHTYECMTTHIRMKTTHIWVNHTHMNKQWMNPASPSHTFIVWMRHVTCEWVMSPTNNSWLIWMRHVTYEWVMSHMNESCTTLSHTFSLRRRSNLKYLDLQIICFSYIINWVTGTPVYSRENLFDILGNPVKTCLKVTKTPVKTRSNFFGSRIYLKSALLRPGHRIREACHVRMSHVSHEWVMAHMNKSCHVRMSHVTYECVMHCTIAHRNTTLLHTLQHILQPAL